MNKIDSACEAIIREFSGSEKYSFEKKAVEKDIIVPEQKNIILPAIVNFKKLASEIRKTAAPVQVSYADVNTFIKELSYE